MSRVGIYYTQALDFLKDIQNNYSKNIDIEGIYTHLSMADVEDDSFTQIQYNRFIDLINSLQKENISIKLKHIANSAGLLRSSKLWLDMVRLGITLYGVYPAEYLEKEINLLPVLSFKSKIIQIKDIPKGEGISYGRTYITKKQTKVAIIPVGYADGYPRLLSNKAYVLIKSKRAKILGRVTMDFIIADISEIEGVKVGDEVVLIGKQGSQEISAWELAKLAETIPYEIFTNLNKRVRKIYLKGGN
jgi:alanine racemase